MKYCDKCGVLYRGNNARCPLCGNILKEQTAANDRLPKMIYPNIPTIYKQFNMLIKLLIWSSVIICVVCLTVNIILPTAVFWSLFVIVGVICCWFCLIFAFHKRSNIVKSIAYEVVILSLISVLWDNITGWHGWSLDYVVPIICGLGVLSIAIVTRFMRSSVGSLTAFLFITFVCGIVAPITIYFCRLLTVEIPTVLCVALSVIVLVSLILFEGKNIKLELHKKFHV